MNGQKNVDAEELAKFEELASRWWDADSEFKPLHDINPLRTQYIADRVSLQGARVLDIGCGGGILAESLCQAGAQVTAIDMADASLSVAKLHLLESGLDIEYVRATAEDMAAEHAGEFNVVTCLEMLEHVPDPASVVASCATLLKPGGQCFFSTINRNPKSYLFMIVGAEYVLQMLKKGTHDYRKFIKPAELVDWARVVGLNCLDITGMSYNPFSKAYTLGKDVDVNYFVHCEQVAQ